MKVMRLPGIFLALFFVPTVVFAQPADRLVDIMRFDDLLEVLAAEADAGADEISITLLEGRGGEGWRETISGINDPNTLGPTLRQNFIAALAPDQVDPLLGFFDTEEGRRIVDVELSARRALLEPGVKEASEEVLSDRRRARDPRLKQIRRFIEVNELLETNIAGALNANFAFLKGMQSVGGRDMVPGGDADLIAQVTSQEDEVRESTELWLYSYLLLAYQPLSDAEMDAYIEFSGSPAGVALNKALLAAFDKMFVEVSRQTGEAAAKVLMSKDI
jgi:hypothetical protein